MCDTAPGEVETTRPRPAPGPAIDPIALEPVDEVEILTLVDNVYDAPLAGDERVLRTDLDTDLVEAPLFEGGVTQPGMIAEHGFSALVTVRRAGRATRRHWSPRPLHRLARPARPGRRPPGSVGAEQHRYDVPVAQPSTALRRSSRRRPAQESSIGWMSPPTAQRSSRSARPGLRTSAGPCM